jgi:hypothetical protein
MGVKIQFARAPNYGQKAVRGVTHVAAAVQIGLW